MTHELDMIHDDQAIQAYLHNIFDLFRPELRLEFESSLLLSVSLFWYKLKI